MEEKIRAYAKRLKEPCGCNYQCSCGVLDAYQVGVYLESLLPKESTVITAAEARKRVEEKIEGESKEWLEKATLAIDTAIRSKLYYTTMTYNHNIYSFVKKQLESKGYKVESKSGGYGQNDYVHIAW